LEAEITKLVAEILELQPDSVAPDAEFVADLGADSMSALELMVAVEKKYGIVIEPEHLPEMLSVRHVTALVGRLLHGE